MKCPYCDQEHAEFEQVCPNTGKSIGGQMYCLYCGERVEAGWVECPKCGTPIGEKVPPSAPPTFKAGLANDQQITSMEMDSISQPEMPAAISAPPGSASSETNPATDLPVTTPEGFDRRETKAARPFLTLGGKNRARALGWGACGCVGLLLGSLVLLVLLVALDPLQLHLWGRVTGSYDAAAEVMPPETDMYLGINIGNALLYRLDRSIAPFINADQAAYYPSHGEYSFTTTNSAQNQPAGIMDDLLSQIEAETGVKIPGDISPWIGQYAGIGVVDMQLSDFGEPVPQGWIIAAEVRNMRRADAFLKTLQADLTELHDIRFVTQEYNGSQIITQAVAEDQLVISFTRAGRMLILASSLDLLKNAIAAPDKLSLLYQEDYDRFTNSRPRDWFASMYINLKGLSELTDELMQSSGLPPAIPFASPSSLLNMQGMFLNAAAIKNGLRLDMYMTSDATSQSAIQDPQAQDLYGSVDQVIQLLPHDTVIYWAGPSFELFWKTIIMAVTGSGSENEYILNEFEQTYGFSLQDDLLNYLTGQFALYATPSTSGYLSEQLDLNFAVNLLVQTEGEVDFQSIANHLNNAGWLGGITVVDEERAGITYHQVREYSSGSPFISFGGSNGLAVIGTDLAAVEAQFSSDNLLVATARYQTTEAAFLYGMKPVMYVDLHSLLANIREGMSGNELRSFESDSAALDTIDVIALSGRLAEPGMIHSSVVLILSQK